MLHRILVTLVLAGGVAAGLPAEVPRRSPDLEVLADGVRLPVTVHARGYRDHPDRLHGHHALVFTGGGAAEKALLRTPVPDGAVAAALDELGLDDGGGIPAAAWADRDDPEAEAPDRRARGDSLEVRVRWEGSGGWVPLEELVADAEGRGLDLRFVDNRRWIPLYRSGCVVCLASCPGAKVANRTYTLRENVHGPMEFRPRTRALPPEGTSATVEILRR